MRLSVVLSAVIMCSVCVTSAKKKPKTFNHGVKLPTTRPLNIGHRGSSGTHPEHTVASYEQAIRDGADVIECDLSITKDHELVCLHDPFLSKHTNVREIPEFATRTSNHIVPLAGNITDWFSFDFTLTELKKLRVIQSLKFRNQQFNGRYEISTFDEYVAVAKGAGRPIGIYPELKMPTFINSQSFLNGSRFEDIVLESLKNHGYTKPDDPCFVQCYEEDSLRYMKSKTELPLVVLVELDEEYLGPYLNDSKLPEWGSLFYGIGAWKTQVAQFYDDKNGYKNWITNGTTDLVKDAKNAGLKVHLYTFRNEDRYLPWDFEQDPIQEYEYFMSFDIDGYFTDFPKTFGAYLASIYREEPICVSAASWCMPILSYVITSALVYFALGF